VLARAVLARAVLARAVLARAVLARAVLARAVLARAVLARSVLVRAAVISPDVKARCMTTSPVRRNPRRHRVQVVTDSILSVKDHAVDAWSPGRCTDRMSLRRPVRRARPARS
jgi:hypothetical protein